MTGNVATSVIEVIHDKDPKEVIWDALEKYISRNDPSKDVVGLTSGDVLVCVYERPTKMKSGLYMPETASRVSEDKFQGVVGMIVKVGPDYGKHRKFLAMDEMPRVGDWIAFRNQDCQAFTLGNRAMRLLEGQYIRMLLTDPDAII